MNAARVAGSTVANLVAAALVLWGCEKKRELPPSVEHGGGDDPARVTEALGVDAATLGDAVDPVAPAGDLKTELERFVNVESCVQERAKMDPLVGDALSALGYETFLRDACRMLQAAKDRKSEACDAIDASSLRTKCKTWVAQIVESGDACPLLFENVESRGRSPSCVAVALRDARLCVAEPRAARRATCEALVQHDGAACNTLLPGERTSCQREWTRWRSLLGSPRTGLPALPEARATLAMQGEGAPTASTDLGAEFARGAVVTVTRDTPRVELGLMGENESVRYVPGPTKKPRVGLAVTFEPSSDPGKTASRATLERFELEIPGEGTVACGSRTLASARRDVRDAGAEPSRTRCDVQLVRSQLDRTRGGVVDLALHGTVAAGLHTYVIDLSLKTFVRDVVTIKPR